MQTQDFTKYQNVKIQEVCRLCLLKKDQMNLIYEGGLTDMLFECASVQITPENGLFNLVCTYCSNEVSRWYIFKQHVLRSFEIGQMLEEKELTGKSVISSHLSQDFSKFVIHQDIKGNDSYIKNKLNISSKDSEANIPQDMHLHLFSYVQMNSNDVSTVPNRVVLKSQIKGLQCSTCKRQFNTTNLYNKHLKTHNSLRSYICSKCEKPFKTSQMLSEHLKRHYNDRRHRCIICMQKFYSKATLNDHMRSHTGEKPFKCNICTRAFGTKAVLRKHKVVHTVREKKYHCDICDTFLLSAGSLETHKRKHTGIKPFVCLNCGYRFFTKEAMQRHFSAIHDTDNNFLCNICSKVCSTKVHLNNHMKKKHWSVSKPLNAVCSECGKQCGSAAELKVHIRVHTGERPYVCDICDKRFIAKGNLNSHKHRHTGNKPYLCNHCGKAFAEKSTLKVHERIHTGEHPYKCNICEKTYIQSNALRNHMKMH